MAHNDSARALVANPHEPGGPRIHSAYPRQSDE